MDLNQLNQRAKLINQSLIESLFKRELLKNKDDILDFVKKRWITGKRPDGSLIGKGDLAYKSFAYQQEKLRQNPIAGGNVDLIATGSLKRDLDIFPLTGGNFTIFSKDEKAINIAAKYGLDVYGLTNEEEEIVISIVSGIVMFIINNFIQTGGSL